MSSEQLIGSWRLVTFELTEDKGDKLYPYGKKPKGYLIYDKSGMMSVQLSSAEQPCFRSENPFESSPEEAQTNHKLSHAYCGRYEVHHNKVKHFLEMCTFPNWINTTKERHFQLQNNQLILTHQLNGLDSTLIWERV